MKKTLLLLIGLHIFLIPLCKDISKKRPHPDKNSFSILLLNERSGMLPPADTISYSGSTNCLNGSLLLTANAAPSGATFQWLLNGVAINNATDSAYTATQSGTYTVLVDSILYPPLNVSFNPDAGFTFSPNNQCSNVPVQFTNTSSGSGLTYLWNFGDPNSANNTSAATNPSHQFIGTTGNGTQSFTTKLTTTNNFGCTSSSSQTITTNQISSTLLGGDGQTTYNGSTYFTSCTSTADTFTFVNHSSTTATNTNYIIQWGDSSQDFNAGSFLTTQHIYTIGNYNMNFIVTGQNGCTDTAVYQVFVGSNPAVGLGNPGNTSICTGSSLTFPISNTASNSPGTVYTVTFNDGSAPITYQQPPPSSVTHTFLLSSCNTNSPAYNNSFSATIEASNPCQSSSATVVPIYVSQKPIAAFDVSPSDTVCINNLVTISNTDPLDDNNVNGTCTPGSSVWQISPSTGWTLMSGALGNDLNLSNPSLWIPGTNALGVTFNQTGTFTVKLKIGNSICGDDSVIQTICVNQLPVANFAINKNTGCAPLNVAATNTPSATTCGINTYNWTVTYTPTAGCSPDISGYYFINGTNASSLNPQFQFTNPGIYTIGLIATSPGKSCTSLPDTQSVVVTGKPNISLTLPSFTCQNQSVDPVATDSCYNTSATYSWSFQGGTPSTSTNFNPGNISFNTVGSYTISLAITNACGTSDTSGQLTVDPLLTISGSSVNPTSCGSSTGSITLTGATPNALYTVTYTVNATTQNVSLTSNAAGNILINNLSAGTYTNISIVANKSCPSNSVGPFILSDPNPPATPTANSNDPLCSGSTLNLTSGTITAGTINYTWTGPNGFTSNLQNPVLPNVLQLDSGIYYVTATLNSCTSVSATVDVIINATPTTPVVNSNSPVCSDGTINLTSTTTPGTGVNFSWTGPDNFTSNNQNPVITNATAAMSGTYSVIATAIQGNCASAAGTAIVTVNPTPVINNVSFLNPASCGSSTGSISLSGLAPNSSFNISYTFNGTPQTGIFTSDAGGNLIITGLAAGSYTNISVILNGCTSNIIAGPYLLTDPNPPALGIVSFSNPTQCSSATGTISINGLFSNTIYTISFLKGASNITVTDTSDSNGVIMIIGLSAGSYTNIIVQLNSCNSTAVAGPFVLIDPTPPAAPATIDSFVYCQGATASILTATATPGNSLNWYDANSNQLPSAPTPLTSLAGTIIYYVSQTNSSTNCESPKVPITVIINPMPTAPVAPGVAYCQNVTAVPLTATADNGNTLHWYDANSNPLPSAPIPVTSIPGSTSYYVSQSNSNQCESPKTLITVITNPIPKIISSSFINPTRCDTPSGTVNLKIVDLNGAIIPSALYKVFYNYNGIPATDSVQSDPTGSLISIPLSSGIYSIIDVSQNGCLSNSVGPYTLVDPNPPSTPLVSNNGSPVCSGNDLILSALSSSGSIDYIWSGPGIIPSPDTTSSAAINIPNVTLTATGTYYVYAMLNNCNSAVASTLVVVKQAPVTPVITSNSPLCVGDTLELMAISNMPTGNPVINYTWIGPGFPSPVNTSNAFINNVQIQDGGTYSVTAYSPSTNCSTSTSTIVGIGGYPTVNLGPDQVLPTGTLFTLSPGITNGPIKSYTWLPATNLNCDTCNNPVATVKEDICYVLNVENIYGCTGTDTVCIKTFCENSQVYIPDAFTPDGDGINDILMVRGTGISVKSFRIFNRWGQLVFERDNFAPNVASFGWDGKVNGVVGEPEVYVYTAEVICDNGVSYTYKGNVSLLK